MKFVMRRQDFKKVALALYIWLFMGHEWPSRNRAAFMQNLIKRNYKYRKINKFCPNERQLFCCWCLKYRDKYQQQQQQQQERGTIVGAAAAHFANSFGLCLSNRKIFMNIHSQLPLSLGLPVGSLIRSLWSINVKPYEELKRFTHVIWACAMELG